MAIASIKSNFPEASDRAVNGGFKNNSQDLSLTFHYEKACWCHCDRDSEKRTPSDTVSLISSNAGNGSLNCSCLV